MSEELENSLQQAVETYLNERLRAINDQIAKLQTDMSEAMTRLHDASKPDGLEGTTLSASIFAHLQTARGQRLAGVPLSQEPANETGALKRAVAEIESQASQTDILKALLSCSVQFAERVAMFIVKNNQVIGWRVSHANDPATSQPIGGVSVPLSAHTGLTKAIHSQASWSGGAREQAEDDLLLDQLGGAPESAAVIPLVVRGKVVAALYADSASGGAINSDALEVLARVAAMSVNIVSIHRGAAAPKRADVSQPVTPAEATRPVNEISPPAEATSSYTPQIEPRVEEPSPAQEPQAAPPAAIEAEPVAPIIVEPEMATIPAAVAPEAEAMATEIAPAAEQPVPESAQVIESPAPAAPLAAIEAPVESSSPQPSVPPPSPEPSFTPSYSTPLGSTRRYGVSEPDLPIEVGEEERRLHNDARRFARLLVSEIKLYNENKVKEGRSNADLYDRLRDDIDRSRQMYDKRVAPPVAARHDYFHQELVNLLAEGDPAKLGQGYPGVSASA